jgi:hypothetical protein
MLSKNFNGKDYFRRCRLMNVEDGVENWNRNVPNMMDASNIEVTWSATFMHAAVTRQ